MPLMPLFALVLATAAAKPATSHADPLLSPYPALCNAGCKCCEYDSCDCHDVCPATCSCSHDSHLVNIVRCSSAATVSPRAVPMSASQIYLDGGRMPQVAKNAFLGRYRLGQLFLNSSGVRAIDPGAFYNLTSLELLDLSYNDIGELRGDEFKLMPKLSQLNLSGNAINRLSPWVFKELPALEILGLSGNNISWLRGDEFNGLSKLRYLYLDGNAIRILAPGAFFWLPALRSLTLHDNALEAFPVGIMKMSLDSVTLGGNPYLCDCWNRFAVQHWLPRHLDVVNDSDNINCAQEDGNLTLLNSSMVFSGFPPSKDGLMKEDNNQFPCDPVISVDETDATNTADIIGFAVASFVVFAVAVAVLLLIAVNWHRKRKYKSPIFIPLSCRDCLSRQPDANLELNTYAPVAQNAFDAFVFYDADDEAWIQRDLMTQLAAYKICLCHHIEPPNISDAIRSSAALLLVISPAFLASWVQNQSRSSLLSHLKSTAASFVFVLLGLGDGELRESIKTMDPELCFYFKYVPYLFVGKGEAAFWEKLKGRLPRDGRDVASSF